MNSQPNQKPTSGGKNIVTLAIVGLVIVVVLLVAWLAIKGVDTSTTETTTPTTTAREVPAIKSDADFQKLENELNETNLDALTTELDKNDTDAAGF